MLIGQSAIRLSVDTKMLMQGVNSMDFPPEAYESLRYGLAARLGDEFPIDPQRQAMLEQKAAGYFTAMRQASSGNASVKFGVRG